MFIIGYLVLFADFHQAYVNPETRIYEREEKFRIKINVLSKEFPPFSNISSISIVTNNKSYKEKIASFEDIIEFDISVAQIGTNFEITFDDLSGFELINNNQKKSLKQLPLKCELIYKPHSVVFGKVISHKGIGISNVSLSFQEIGKLIKTDLNGYFRLNLNPQHQLFKHTLTISKEGYENINSVIYPGNSFELILNEN